MQVGLAIKPGTTVEELAPWAGQIDMALVMTVEPGFGGQKFMEDMMPKVCCVSVTLYNLYTVDRDIKDACVSPQVSWLRSQFPSLDIEVDGGVGPDSIHRCAEVHKYIPAFCRMTLFASVQEEPKTDV